MRKERVKTVALVLMVAMFAGVGFAADPEYQAIPEDAAQILASGIADATGPGGTVYVEYWVWNGGNGYYYYTYQIHNVSTEDPFEPFVKHRQQHAFDKFHGEERLRHGPRARGAGLVHLSDARML